MREYKTISVSKLVESKVTCNRCGMVYDDENSIHGYEEWQWDSIHAFSVDFGYGSHHDMEKWKFDLCETCIEEFVNTFKVKVQKLGTDPFGDELPDIDNNQ